MGGKKSGKKRIELDENIMANIMELHNDGKSVPELREIINNKYKMSHSYSFYYSRITTFKKNTTSVCSDDNNDSTENKKTIDNNISKPACPEKEPTNETNPPYESENPDDTEKDLDNKTQNHFETLHKNIRELKSEISKLENHIKTCFSEINKLSSKITQSSISTSTENPSEFLSIYTSSKSKKSISINSELKDRIVEHMAKYHGIENNESSAIDSALLIALYNDPKKNNI